MNLASEVSSVLNELESVKAETRILREREIALETENTQLRDLLGRTQVERDTYLRQSEAMKSILTQAGSGLVNAMNAFKAGERELQEQPLGLGQTNEMPTKFISEGTKALHAVG
jgi:regulator of replication initiation timing